MNNGYKESTGQAWKPAKEGDVLEGLYINKETNVGKNDSNLYHIERLDNNEVVRVWGTTVLDHRMSPVKVGQQVRITYQGLGERQGGKQAPHLFKVEYKDIDAQDIFDPAV